MSYEPRPIIQKKTTKHDKKIPEPLPQLPFAMSVVAPRKSGKTSLVCGLIKDVYRKVCKEVVICSPTALLDPTYQSLSKYENVWCTDQVNNEVLQAILDKQSAMFATDKTQTMLLYIDDSGDFFRRAQAQKLMNVLFTRCRHSGISLIVCVQSPQHLSTIQKSNSTQYLVFRCDTKSMKTLAEQLQTKHKMADEVYQYLLDATEKRFSFAYIDLEGDEPDDIYRYAFN